MDRAGILKVLTKIEVVNSSELNGWEMCSCPLAAYRPAHQKGTDSKPSFGIHIEEDGISIANCFTCKFRGSIPTLCYELARLTDDQELREYGRTIERDELFGGSTEFDDWETKQVTAEETYRVTRFPGEGSYYKFPSIFSNRAAIRYLGRRGISFDTCIAANLRFDARQQRILFPVFDYWTGEYAGCTGRSIKPADSLSKLDPKVRDYGGLQKDRVLLRRPHCGERRRVPGQSVQRAQRESHYTILVEGLFAYLRLTQLGYGHCTYALLGSSLTEGKVAVLKDIGRAIYWFTDDDPAGHACIYGDWDDKLSRFKPDTGALHKMYGEVAQFVPVWPEGKDDPDQLTRQEIERMIDDADLYVK